MNKTIITLISFLAIMFFTGNVYASTFTQTGGAGTTVTVPDTAGTSAALTFTPSPGVLIDGATSSTQFTVVSGNIKATDNAIVFCLTNASPVVYQTTQDLTSVTANTALTGNDLAAGATTGFTQRQ